MGYRDEVVTTSVVFPKKLHRSLKLTAAAAGVSSRLFIREAVTAAIRKVEADENNKEEPWEEIKKIIYK